MRSRFWGVTGLLTLIALGVIWFLSNYELSSRTEKLSPQARARQEPFLAARRWLGRLDFPNRYLEGLEGRPPLSAGTLVVLARQRRELSGPAQEHLLASLRVGAHLLVEARALDDDDRLLDALGVERRKLENGEYRHEVDGLGNWRFRDQDRHIAPLSQVTIGASAPLAVRMAGEPMALVTDRAPLWQAQQGEHARILHLAVGQGRVTVVTDMRFIKNWGLARFDHAELFWQLLTQPSRRTDVVFLRTRAQGLGAWLQTHAWRVLLALTLLIIAWLWALAPRLGPIHPDPEASRRRLLDHLRANGRLLWSQGARSELGAAARTTALERLHRQFPQLKLHTQDEQREFLQRELGLTAMAAARVLEAPAAGATGGFQSLIRACQQLHAALGHKRGLRPDPLYEATGEAASSAPRRDDPPAPISTTPEERP